MSDLKLTGTYTFNLVIDFQYDAFFDWKYTEDRNWMEISISYYLFDFL